MTIAVGILCAITALYLYVTVLGYLCDIYDRRKLEKKDQKKTKRQRTRWENARERTAMPREEAKKRSQIAETRKRQVKKARKSLSPIAPKVRQARAGRA